MSQKPAQKPDTPVEFRQGQVWLSPRGTIYQVDNVWLGQATLRVGLDRGGRTVRRPAGSVKGWRFMAPLVTGDLKQRALDGEFSKGSKGV